MIDGRAIGEAFVGAMIVAFFAGALVATALLFGLPWLWQYAKPLIHSWTA